jgi:hypothetical protein
MLCLTLSFGAIILYSESIQRSFDEIGYIERHAFLVAVEIELFWLSFLMPCDHHCSLKHLHYDASTPYSGWYYFGILQFKTKVGIINEQILSAWIQCGL